MKKRKIAVLTYQDKLEMYNDHFKDEFEGTEVIQYGSDFSYETLSKKAIMLENLGYDAIVSRGFTCSIIQKHVNLPLVVLEPDMLDVLDSMIRLSPAKGSKVTLLLHDDNNLLRYGELSNALNTIFGVDAYVENYCNMNDYFPKVDEIIMQNRILLTGYNGVQRCRELEGVCSPLYVGENAIRAAITEAIKIVDIRKKDAVHNKKIETILSSKSEGIVTVDKALKIGWINDYARSILSIPQNEKITSIDIKQHLPEIKWNSLLDYNFKNVVTNTGSEVRIIMNTKVLNSVEEDKEVLITFRQASKVLEEEKKIRAELHKKRQHAKFTMDDIKGDSKVLRECKAKIVQCAQFDSNTLIYGESGVGKELFAQCIHNESVRSHEPFYAINCAALPENLLESELFGYSEGSFTGAKKGGKAGIFELAHKGTVFLDEIGELSMASQSALLRVLQEKEIRRIGDDGVIPIDVRVIAASHKDIYREVQENRFRQDLFYRLGTVFLTIPPLRERRTDILPLINSFIENFSDKYGIDYTVGLTPQAYKFLCEYTWEGNVRELQNFVERIFVLGYYDKELEPEDIKLLLANSPQDMGNLNALGPSSPLLVDRSSAVVSRQHMGLKHKINADDIEDALRQADGNKTKAAQILGISRTHLWRLLK